MEVTLVNWTQVNNGCSFDCLFAMDLQTAWKTVWILISWQLRSQLIRI